MISHRVRGDHWAAIYQRWRIMAITTHWFLRWHPSVSTDIYGAKHLILPRNTVIRYRLLLMLRSDRHQLAVENLKLIEHDISQI